MSKKIIVLLVFFMYSCKYEPCQEIILGALEVRIDTVYIHDTVYITKFKTKNKPTVSTFNQSGGQTALEIHN